MVNITNRRYSRDSCSRQPNFNVEGSMKAVYCRQHAEESMVNVVLKHCSLDSARSKRTSNLKVATRRRTAINMLRMAW